MKISPITLLGPLVPHKIKGRDVPGLEFEPETPKQEPEQPNDDDRDDE